MSIQPAPILQPLNLGYIPPVWKQYFVDISSGLDITEPRFLNILELDESGYSVEFRRWCMEVAEEISITEPPFNEVLEGGYFGPAFTEWFTKVSEGV